MAKGTVDLILEAIQTVCIQVCLLKMILHCCDIGPILNTLLVIPLIMHRMFTPWQGSVLFECFLLLMKMIWIDQTYFSVSKASNTFRVWKCISLLEA